jgi:hypothetical protein
VNLRAEWAANGQGREGDCDTIARECPANGEEHGVVFRDALCHVPRQPGPRWIVSGVEPRVALALLYYGVDANSDRVAVHVQKVASNDAADGVWTRGRVVCEGTEGRKHMVSGVSEWVRLPCCEHPERGKSSHGTAGAQGPERTEDGWLTGQIPSPYVGQYPIQYAAYAPWHCGTVARHLQPLSLS